MFTNRGRLVRVCHARGCGERDRVRVEVGNDAALGLPASQVLRGAVDEHQVTEGRRDHVGVDDAVLAAVLGQLPDAVIAVDRDCRLVWGNVAAERLFGVSAVEAVGRSGLELVHPDDLQLALLSLGTVLHKSVGTPIEVRVLTPTGWRLVEIVGASFGADADGWVLLCLRDLTLRRRWEVAGDEVARFRSLIQNSAMVTMLVTADGCVQATSAALTRQLGHDPEAVAGRPLVELVADADQAAVLDALARTAPPMLESRVTLEAGLRHRDSSGTVPFALTIVNLLDDPTVGGLVVSGHDITHQKQAEAELRQAMSLLNATLDSTADGILVVNLDGQITSFNQRFADMWHIDASVLASGDDSAALAFVMDQLANPDAFRAKIEELYANPHSQSVDVLEFKDGRVFERYSQPQRVGGRVAGRVWSFRDVTEQRRLESQLAHQAFHDPLTDLANQALFRDRVQHAVARLASTDGHLAVLFIDLDNFKTVNDSLGHPAGDELLVGVADRLLGCLRGADSAARLGGDEFAVLIEDLSGRDDATDVAQRIMTLLDRPFTVGTMEVTATASVGIAFDEPGITCDQLLRNADLAMYRAKGLGKAGYQVFEPTMHAAALDRLEMEGHLRRAIQRDELVVHYQPIVDLQTGQVTAFEALIRWGHPTRGLLLPGAFIPLAEDTGLISEMGQATLTEACTQARRWQEAGGQRLGMNVNLSPRQLLDPDIVRHVAETLAVSGLDPADLILEITEQAIIRDPESAARHAKGLAELGLRLAVDDFGTGYSSLLYLQRFPIAVLKIDRSFIEGIEKGPDGASLARAIVRLADSLGLTAIAEGVETAGQACVLREIGCVLAQGFHLGRPADAQTIQERLKVPGLPLSAAMPD